MARKSGDLPFAESQYASFEERIALNQKAAGFPQISGLPFPPSF
ncbi:hypothetical protein [Paenibacillus sp. GP183]|nr:hypothetical protein [Paenibacillus sp. GP183]